MTEPTVTRRQMIAASASLSIAAAPAAAATTTAYGRVIDAATDSGIADVMVSNGDAVVLTDAAGRWALDLAVGDSVFVIKPAGWMTEINPETMLPRFAYIHSPSGSAAAIDLHYPGVAPTGALPASIDFALRRQAEPSKFDVVLYTDPQPETLAEIGYIRDDVVARTIDLNAAFGITHGDVMFDDLAHYDRYNQIVGTVGLPWYNCPGNHDINYEAPSDALSRETFKRVYGTRYHAFLHAGAVFFVLDNVEYFGADPTRRSGKGRYRGNFGDRQLNFIRNVLRHVPPDALVVCSFHVPLKTLAGRGPGTTNVDNDAFLSAIATHRNSVSLSGHTHTNEHWYFGAHHHHVLSAVSGSWWSGPFDARGIPVAVQSDGAPNGSHLLSVDGNRYSTTLIPAHDPAVGQIRLGIDCAGHHVGAISRADLGNCFVMANLFDGGPRSVVEIALDAGKFVAMQKSERVDPYVVDLYARNQATKKRWVQPGKSSHLWQARLPDILGVGAHAIQVRGTDEFGRRHAASMVLEVTD